MRIIEIKNKKRFYNFINKNIKMAKNTKRKVQQFYLSTLESQAKLTQNGKSNFIVPPIYTKSKKFEIYPYFLNKNNKKIIIEL